MPETAYKRYLLILLALILASSFVDRLALGVVLQSIKQDLHLTDTQLGVLTGIAFAIFYSAMGIPIARLADRGNRVVIISLAATLWSIGVAACGFAGSFVQLLLIRVGVAVGEAGCIPTSHSLIADHFSREERPRAVATYMLGGSFGMMIGYFLGGLLNELWGWRTAFVALAMPGLVLAGLARFTLKEPRVAHVAHAAGQSAPGLQTRKEGVDKAPLKDVLVVLWATRTFRHLLLCFAVSSFFAVGLQQWQPAFFIRSHGMQTAELGTWLALTTGLGSILGTYAGGYLAFRYARNNERLQFVAMTALLCLLAIVKSAVFLAPGIFLPFTLLALGALGNAMIGGPLFSALQTLVPQPMRATSIAIIYLFSNLVGLGLGPLATGAISDALRPYTGEESLRFALLCLCPGYLWAAWHMWRASRTIESDLHIAQTHPDNSVNSVFEESPVRDSSAICR